MKLASLLSTLAISAFLATSASAAPIVYDVNRTVGVGSVSGTITTDGTFGVLSTGNITGWSLTINAGDADGSFLLQGGINSSLEVAGTAMTADADSIDFNFSGDGFALFQNPYIGSSQNFWCVEGPNANCTGLGNGETVTRNNFGVPHITLTDSQAIATVRGGTVPEPASLALVGAALAGLAMARRRA